MTQNQLAYWRDKETQRTNAANEVIKFSDVAEKRRHNKAEEALTDKYNKWKYTNEDSKIMEQTLNDFLFKPLTSIMGGLFS